MPWKPFIVRQLARNICTLLTLPKNVGFNSRLEVCVAILIFHLDIKKHILERLTAAEGLEKYLGNKYVGAKRFGLEGGESFIPLS
jgi:2-oxoglutarate dehydrogenase complex dehydrogenase (E1) component-like enzyme